ncbi:MAG: ATP-binding cassette domain-containing protein [Muribaculaceae bacterium]|nr:ATP-binding cassette domain-containing protein [Muribaculaceae bacterium]MBQ4138324.1 ATP-binding cassette domain-containing protein [Muribaculaceae bacterium]
MNFIEIKDVVKQYDGHLALDRVSMDVPEGIIYGLLGPNGAGKTSLIRIINMITKPDSGEVLLGGKPLQPSDVAQIGYLPEERGLYKKMKVGDHIVYLARLKGVDKATAVQRMNQWLERFDLTEWRDKKVEALSKGMQQKVQFIATVIHEPRLLIFDEPFSGFDPVNAEQLKQEILRLKDQGSTILFSTHNMESVEAICERITLINSARVVLEGSVAAIKQEHKKHLYEIEQVDRAATLPTNDALYSIEQTTRNSTLIRLNDGVASRDVISWLNEHVQLAGFHELLPSMNEIFIETVKALKS